MLRKLTSNHTSNNSLVTKEDLLYRKLLSEYKKKTNIEKKWSLIATQSQQGSCLVTAGSFTPDYLISYSVVYTSIHIHTLSLFYFNVLLSNYMAFHSKP